MTKKIRNRKIMSIIFTLWMLGEISGERFPKSNKKKIKKDPKMHVTPRQRVLYGQSAAKDQYRYVVSLLRSEAKLRVCTGSLIAKTWIITVGHCFNPDLKYVQCGDMSIPWEHTDCKSEVLDQILNPSYYLRYSKGLPTKKSMVSGPFTDIGLVRVHEITITGLGRLHAADCKTFFGRAVRFAGFGMSYISAEHSSESRERLSLEDTKKELQIGEGVIFNINKPITIAPKCTNIKHGPYFGDSGGPVIVDDKIVGVLGAGYRFGNSRIPVVNFCTPISPYLDWIRQTINSNYS